MINDRRTDHGLLEKCTGSCRYDKETKVSRSDLSADYDFIKYIDSTFIFKLDIKSSVTKFLF